MHALRLLVLGLLGTFFFGMWGCDDDPVGPRLPRNPREYTWTLDTLAYPGSLQTVMRYIWGSSANNIYVCGSNDRASGRMYHFDGQSWTNVKLLITEGGPLSRVGFFNGIVGFSADNIYAVGDVGIHFDPFLIHFDGSQWSEINVPDGTGLLSIWARSPGEIWIGGFHGFLARYNGSRFIQDTLPYTFDTRSMDIQVNQINGHGTITHLVSAVSPDTLFAPIFYFYERIGEQWEVRDSSYEYARIFIDPGGTVYRYGYDGVQRRQGANWVSTLSGLTVGRNGMAASSENNMFVVGIAGTSPAGRIYHFNGSDWFEYTQLRLEEVFFQAVWTDGNEAFVIGTTYDFPMKTIVLHGK
jgi:hypothetical protein